MKSKDPIWNFFNVVDKDNKTTVTCLDCLTVVSAKAPRLRAHREKCPANRPSQKTPLPADNAPAEPVTHTPEPATHEPTDKKSRVMQSSLTSYSVSTDQFTSKQLDKQIAKMFFACNLPFNIADHSVWKETIQMLRPGYQPPNCKDIGGHLLDQVHEKITTKVSAELKGKGDFVLIQDGWSDIHNTPVIATSLQCDSNVYFMSAIDTEAVKMNQYQKVYMNQIHSSSLLGQLAQMWRSQMLCDALIRTGNVTTKAHRVVLVAACPMLQSMDNASVGSHLEVRLAADIKQEAVNSFLQYLYEGFMMLSEENCKDVEKVARLLQVDSVTKCCIDFYNCLQKKTGVPVYSNTQYKYSSADLLEFRHVRTTDLQKTIQERMMKRAAADSGRPASPGGKRQRTQQRPSSPNIDLAMFGQKADDTLSMAHSYMGNQSTDPWERVPRLGAVHGQRTQQPKPGVIEIVEDSLEILQTQPPDKDGNKSAPPIIQKSLAISVSSQINQSSDVHVVNINDTSSHPTAATDGPIMSTGRDSITVSPLTVMPGSSSSSISSPLIKDQHKPSYDSQKEMSDRGQFAKKSQSVEHQSSTPQQRLFPVSMSPANMSPINQVSQPKKSFAAGSASQAANMSHSHESPSINKRPSSSAGSEIVDRPPSSDSSKDLGAKSKLDDGSASNSTDMAPDLSIVKVEPTIDDPGLDMYVDVPDESMIQAQQRDREHDDESDLEVEEASGDWSRDEMSNETGGNDQNNSWYIGQFKAPNKPVFKTKPMPACKKAKKYPGWKEEPSDDPNEQEIEFMPGHKLVHITGHKRACAYCNILRLKTKSGWAIKSYYKCEACDVCLCKGKKDCFPRYHELRMEQPDLSPKMLLKTLKEATASQTPKKQRKSTGSKSDNQYSLSGQPEYINIAPKYEAFTSMMAQSISNQLKAYGGALDPDDPEASLDQCYNQIESVPTKSPKGTPNNHNHGENEETGCKDYNAADTEPSNDQSSTGPLKTTNEQKRIQELDDEQLFSQAIDNQQEYLL